MYKKPILILLFTFFSMLSVIAAGLSLVDGDNTADSTGIEHRSTKTLMEHYIDSTYDAISVQTAGLDKRVYSKAVIGYLNMKAQHMLSNDKNIISVVDFTKPSTQKRLWVIDLDNEKVLFNSMVAHGHNTGEQWATCFSNQCSSYMSSLGFYVTGETYEGKHGLSLKLNGMDKGFNDNALTRGIVVHAADYVSESFIAQVGRIGRSQGCPALPADIAPDVINTIKDGTCLFLYYPDHKYEQSTQFYNTQTAEKVLEGGNEQLGMLR
jgi:hypothetical protein